MPNALLKDNKSETMLTTRQEKIKHNKLENVRETLNKINENLNNVLCVTRFNDETYREYQNFKYTGMFKKYEYIRKCTRECTRKYLQCL